MSKATLTPADGTTTTTPVTSTGAPCCPSRRGQRDIRDASFKRIFRQYARSTAHFSSRSAVRYNPSSVRWEDYYYAGHYGYHLSYQGAPDSRGAIRGTLTVTVRAYATVHSSPTTLRAAAPSLFHTVTDAGIAQAFSSWSAEVQRHWTQQRFTIQLVCPDCSGNYVMSFVLQQTPSRSNAHKQLTVLNMDDPSSDPTWGSILSNPADRRHATAQSLRQEWRSNTAKFNLGDRRGSLVFAHEYGHWIGWGDEYIEGSQVTVPGSGSVFAENRLGAGWVPPRVATRFVNPTREFQSAHGTNLEVLDITQSSVPHCLMSSMQARVTHPPRLTYTVVDDFITLYNRDHYGGSRTAYCQKVTGGN